MSTKENYNNILNQATHIALATETLDGHTPSVRVVNFLYFEDTPNTIYVATARDTTKVREIETNNHVSFTTLPVDGADAVRVTGATATQVNEKKPELFVAMDKKYDSFSFFDDAARANMNAYALTFPAAEVFAKGLNTITFD